ncbi:MAG: hypothetical protein R2795_17130 [Saprospiraceae bacterium]
MNTEKERREYYERINNKYFGVLASLQVVEDDNLHDLLVVPNLKWVFHQKMLSYFETSSFGTPYPHNEYKCIDEFGNKMLFIYEGVTGLEFKEETKPRSNFPGYNYHVASKIADTEGNVKTIYIRGNKFTDFIVDLVDTCHLLNKYKTWDIFELYEENQKLVKTNTILKDTLEEWKNKYDINENIIE